MKSTILGLTTAVLAAVGSAQAQDKSPGDPDAGASVFKRCMACHAVGPDAKNGVGPVLNGVVGRAAGTYPGYNYSAANKNSGLTWDESTLTTYLHAPRKLVPGTKMTFAGLSKDQEIADVIAYLRQFNAQGQKASP
ncbi:MULTISPECIES: cytochrome c family protein [unclassified Mesorhizobium]|uniref:c-type cytochrome n=1 Tax=unclassified Mesorhizobium TaxID=325217 RepID=UPI00112E0521|nr:MULTISPECIES: cytochrome c family protein [unclassified Mesorhizobium]TPK97019.1 cytochrome c family protein [Mesorhizobium sp. B2-4-16]TPL65038.1 cytochrome c family protein [Mesorhizobium sp. B2-4-3]